MNTIYYLVNLTDHPGYFAPIITDAPHGALVVSGIQGPTPPANFAKTLALYKRLTHCNAVIIHSCGYCRTITPGIYERLDVAGIYRASDPLATICNGMGDLLHGMAPKASDTTYRVGFIDSETGELDDEPIYLQSPEYAADDDSDFLLQYRAALRYNAYHAGDAAFTSLNGDNVEISFTPTSAPHAEFVFSGLWRLLHYD